MTTSRSAPTAPRRRVPRAERERQMLEVAEEVFSERGYLASSMDEIAERVGVSKPMLYEYFGSKEGLLIACTQQARSELLRVTTTTALKGGTPEEMLRNGLTAYFEFIQTHGRAWLLLRTEGAFASPSAAAEMEASRAEHTNLIVASLSRFAPSESVGANLEPVAEVIVGGTERLAVWCQQHPEVSAEQAADLVMLLARGGLAELFAASPNRG
ncbi:MAG TPA: TetR/AcrR family transcriptional regulator [Pseudonocardiaceae bacterium]|jgi:AcrR family transcriptional regulator|nr:TetR/AcrR family transcriptional regulator [Pseudonocardiaceae bacterium]